MKKISWTEVRLVSVTSILSPCTGVISCLIDRGSRVKLCFVERAIVGSVGGVVEAGESIPLRGGRRAALEAWRAHVAALDELRITNRIAGWVATRPPTPGMPLFAKSQEIDWDGFPAWQIQVQGPDTWYPGITGTLNKTGKTDLFASSFLAEEEAWRVWEELGLDSDRGLCGDALARSPMYRMVDVSEAKP